MDWSCDSSDADIVVVCQGRCTPFVTDWVEIKNIDNRVYGIPIAQWGKMGGGPAAMNILSILTLLLKKLIKLTHIQ